MRNRYFNPLSANPTKWSNTLKQFVGNLPTNCFCAFDHFVILALKGLKTSYCVKANSNFEIHHILLISLINNCCIKYVSRVEHFTKSVNALFWIILVGDNFFSKLINILPFISDPEERGKDAFFQNENSLSSQ